MKLYRLLLLIVFMLVFCVGCGKANTEVEKVSHAYQVVDDEGTVLKLKEKPSRILTTHFHLDNMLLGVVPQERVVAISDTMDDDNVSYAEPNTITKPKRFHWDITTEQVLALKPDLIIARPYSKERIQTYRDMGIPVYVSKMPVSIKEIKEKITGIAAVCGEPEHAKALNGKIDKVLAVIESKIPKDKHFSKSAILVSKMNPNYGGKGCAWDDILKMAKLRNGAAEVGISNGQLINREVIIKSNPDYLVLSKAWEIKHGNEHTYKDEFRNDPALKELRAVKADSVMYLKDKHIYASNQNCVYSIKRLVNMAYGPIFPEVEETMLKGY